MFQIVDFFFLKHFFDFREHFISKNTSKKLFGGGFWFGLTLNGFFFNPNQIYSIKHANQFHLTNSTKPNLDKPNLQKINGKSNPSSYWAWPSSAQACLNIFYFNQYNFNIFLFPKPLKESSPWTPETQYFP